MAARERVALLAGLEARHLMSGLRWAFYAAGTDVQEDRDLSERLYQVYVVVIAAVVAALSWGQVISLVGVARDGLGTTLSASLAAAALVAALRWRFSWAAFPACERARFASRPRMPPGSPGR